MRRSLPFLALMLLCVTLSGGAQDSGRTLYWRSLDVSARLDADGRLHVIERQAIVFDGDWNGGERIFNIRRGQKLALNGVTRIDANGVRHALTDGDLEDVDNYDLIEGTTLRWRSRLPSDPLFSHQEIIYELDYTLSNILIANEEDYLLDHDFAFPDRSGIIGSFTLALDADPAWQSSTLPLRVKREFLEPGASVVERVQLKYAGAGKPSGVRHPASPVARWQIVAALIFVLAFYVLFFLIEQKKHGRFAALHPVEAVDESWLRENVFSMPPEVVGAAWDNRTSAPEVAALLARMVLEGKLESRVEKQKRKDVLHLELKVGRDELSYDERQLINALFVASTRHTDTERIKQHYKKSGFDPAGLIRAGVEGQVKALLPRGATKIKAIDVLFYVLRILTIVAIAAVTFASATSPVVVVAALAVIGTGFVGLIVAAVYRGTVIGLRQKAAWLIACVVIGAAPVFLVAAGLLAGTQRLGLPELLPLLLLYTFVTSLVLESARTREDPERLELRRRLAAGRAFFIHQLRQAKPALKDEWFPYFMAFGLGPHIDQWFSAFGGTVREHAIATSTMSMGSSSSHGWSGGGPLFGGGGGFGGGGAGRSWAAAATTMSSGVSAPSSSSSGGGGGGGGGSSGGGGGGGW